MVICLNTGGMKMLNNSPWSYICMKPIYSNDKVNIVTVILDITTRMQPKCPSMSHIITCIPRTILEEETDFSCIATIEVGIMYDHIVKGPIIKT